MCGMLLRSGGMRKEECPLDLATRSPDDIGGRTSTGQVRSETPDVRGWRNNLKEKWRQWRKGCNFQGVCLFARKVKMDQYIQLRSFFFFYVMSVLICCEEEGSSAEVKAENAGKWKRMQQALESRRRWYSVPV